jgi:hypothetical protein
MAADIPVIREVVERVCARKDVLDACKRRDLGTVITTSCPTRSGSAGPLLTTMMPVVANSRHTHIRHIHRGCPVS